MARTVIRSNQGFSPHQLGLRSTAISLPAR